MLFLLMGALRIAKLGIFRGEKPEVELTEKIFGGKAELLGLLGPQELQELAPLQRQQKSKRLTSSLLGFLWLSASKFPKLGQYKLQQSYQYLFHSCCLARKK